MNIGRKSLSLVLAAALMFGVVSVGGGAAAVVYTDAAEGNYYSSITATSGTQLLGQLHDLITTTHTFYPTYSSLNSYLYASDPGENGKGLLEFYTHETLTHDFGSTTGIPNKEHVWCKSLTNGLWKQTSKSYTGGGSDMHHIRPTEMTLNSTRSSNKYGKVTSGKEAYSKTTSGAKSKLGGYVGGGVFEPLDNVKGDAARIVMYVYTHYNTYMNVSGSTNGSGNSSYFGTLNFTDIMAPSSKSAAIELLLEWNELDPVDAIEEKRNEEAFKVQGNRNPFIDHPEYASAIWGDGSYVPPVSDITPTAIAISPSVVNMSVGGTANLTVTATPSNASKEVTWATSANSVVSVIGGRLEAHAEGTATITATSAKDPNVKATAQVTVTKPVAEEEGSFTITLDSFDLVDNYNFQNWSSGGVEGIAYIFGGNASYPADKGMQFSKPSDGRSYYLANTTAVPGRITSITAKSHQYANDWTVLTSSASFGKVTGKPTGGTNQGQKQVPTEGVTWEIGGNDSFFAITYDTTAYAGYLDSITVKYVTTQGETPPTPHQHDFEYEDYSDETHLVACKTCDYLEEEPHVYSSDTDTTCNLCGHVRTVHIHEYQYKPLDDTYHSITCKGCDKVNDREVHVYTDAEDTTCDKCGYVRTIGGGTHEHTLVYEEEDDTYHTVTCTGCDEVNKREEHEYTDDSDTTCNKCGYVRTVVDAQKVAAFHTAVQNIKTSGSLSARGQSIAAALNAYDALSDDEKEAAKSDYQALQAAIEAYNQTVNAYNERAEETNDLFVPKKKAEE